MLEKNKMLTGELYNPSDNELLNDRIKCKTFCFNYNNLPPNEVEKKKEIIKTLFDKTGNEFLIEPAFWCDYGYNIEIGENFYSNHNLVILDPAKVSFGNNVFIGPNCGFYTAIHPIVSEERNICLEYAKPITVGDNVWFGGNVVVLPDVKIGSNVVIGAGSVVTKSIPDNSVAVGNPCKVIRQITEKDKIFNK